MMRLLEGLAHHACNPTTHRMDGKKILRQVAQGPLKNSHYLLSAEGQHETEAISCPNH